MKKGYTFAESDFDRLLRKKVKIFMNQTNQRHEGSKDDICRCFGVSKVITCQLHQQINLLLVFSTSARSLVQKDLTRLIDIYMTYQRLIFFYP